LLVAMAEENRRQVLAMVVMAEEKREKIVATMN
jgi:hypothetical protein